MKYHGESSCFLLICSETYKHMEYIQKSSHTYFSPPTSMIGWKGLNATHTVTTRRRWTRVCTQSGLHLRTKRSYTCTRPSSVTATNTLLLYGDHVTAATAAPRSRMMRGVLKVFICYYITRYCLLQTFHFGYRCWCWLTPLEHILQIDRLMLAHQSHKDSKSHKNLYTYILCCSQTFTVQSTEQDKNIWLWWLFQASPLTGEVWAE